ncbi:MAG: hypothetical protein WBI53_10650 [Paludibacter sp.]
MSTKWRWSGRIAIIPFGHDCWFPNDGAQISISGETGDENADTLCSTFASPDTQTNTSACKKV